MSFLSKTALAAVCLASASTADAATFYSFDFATQGYTGSTSTSEALNNVSINLKISTARTFSPTGSGSYSVPFPVLGGSINLRQTGIDFLQNLVVGRDPDDFISASACFDNQDVSAVPQTGIFASTAGCGVASIFLNSGAADTPAITYQGKVTDLTVSIVEGDFDEVASFVNGVPEPSTWALMLTGFGMVGYALRRRSRFSYAA